MSFLCCAGIEKFSAAEQHAQPIATHAPAVRRCCSNVTGPQAAGEPYDVESDDEYADVIREAVPPGLVPADASVIRGTSGQRHI